MKKILLGIALSVVVLQGCKKDEDEVAATVVLTIEEQNTYDDAAAKDFMTKNYFNSKGVITAFDSTISTDDNEKKLIEYDYKTLPSGVIYIIRPGAQPDPGKAIGTTDVISTMQIAKSYVSTKVDDKMIYGSESTFSNSVLSGDLVKDPAYFYVKSSVLKKYNDTYSTTYGRNFYEIEGLQEGLKYFKSFALPDSADYNMQGVIIVPSRAAFARDATIYGAAYNNRCFVFNFQLFDSKTRVLPGED
ncbi:hypothetical protein [Epilithonimonas tenax]|uniref:hypothetical protein n=1 Tax=Epilithonimonas tenax TaxID=191577 RepID=UPI0003FD54D6|nr:hypothetical protein [Epilithonimonas tenax]